MAFTSEQLSWRQRARQFAEREIAPISLRQDQKIRPEDAFEWEIVRKGSQAGFRTAAVPKKFGGAGIDLVTQVLIMGEFARADSAIARTFLQAWRWSSLLCYVGTEDQQRRFLDPFMNDDTFLIGFASTEPNAGSDNRRLDDPGTGLMMRAERAGDSWTLNGTKQFIAQSNVARLLFVATRTDRHASLSKGMTVFLVPTDTPGVRIGRVDDKLGWRFNQNAEVIFDNVRLPHANVVGEVNRGADVRLTRLSDYNQAEVGMAANAVGVCDRAVEMAVQYATSKHLGSQRLSEYQTTRLKVAEMQMLTEALRSYVLRIAQASDDGEEHDPASNTLVACYSADVLQRVARLNMELHGRDGVLRAVGAEKLVRDATVWSHLAGDSVRRMSAARFA